MTLMYALQFTLWKIVYYAPNVTFKGPLRLFASSLHTSRSHTHSNLVCGWNFKISRLLKTELLDVLHCCASCLRLASILSRISSSLCFVRTCFRYRFFLSRTEYVSLHFLNKSRIQWIMPLKLAYVSATLLFSLEDMSQQEMYALLCIPYYHYNKQFISCVATWDKCAH